MMILISVSSVPTGWIRIGGDRVLTSELRQRLRSLHSEEIRFVLDAYDDAVKRTKILHTRQYLQGLVHRLHIPVVI